LNQKKKKKKKRLLVLEKLIKIKILGFSGAEELEFNCTCSEGATLKDRIKKNKIKK
jgi:hypothetical protein